LEAFNASHDNIKLVLAIVQNDVAYDQLCTEIASGNAPDIVGPVGIRGANEFLGLWLDLQPLVDATGYDLGQYDEATVEFYREDGGLTGIPFAVFPSVIYFNRDLFDEAGLDYPPQAYGEPYADGAPGIGTRSKNWPCC
jgi:multiple sugar transport system substrate-binding protein